MSHINPWSPSGGRTADAARMWSTIGAMRFEEKETNVDWRVQRYWLDEVARVMPDEQKPKGKQNTGARSRAFKSFLPGGGKVDEEDYEVMGLVSSPPPTSSAIKTAFRRQCLKWHPDKQQDKSEEERAQVKEFAEKVKKHEAEREKRSKGLLTELAKLRQDISDICNNFNERVKALKDTKMVFDTAIYEGELLVIRLAQSRREETRVATHLSLHL